LGAYGFAIATTEGHLPFSVGVLCGVLAALLGGMLLVVPAIRLRGDYFAVGTLGFQLFVNSVMQNWTRVTNGAMGIPNIPQPGFWGITITTERQSAVVVAVLCMFCLALVGLLVSSPFGRVLRAISQDEKLAESLGKDVKRFKIQVVLLSSMIAGCAGVIYAGYVTFIDPSSFTVDESIFILAMVVVGGLGSLWGSVVGSVVLTIFPEMLRLVELPSAEVGNIREILFGASLIVMCIWRPQGVLGEDIFLIRAEDPNAK
jgi:branched-chain amino acid transport system permease protein